MFENLNEVTESGRGTRPSQLLAIQRYRGIFAPATAKWVTKFLQKVTKGDTSATGPLASAGVFRRPQASPGVSPGVYRRVLASTGVYGRLPASANVCKCLQMPANVCKCLQMPANVCKCLQIVQIGFDLVTKKVPRKYHINPPHVAA